MPVNNRASYAGTPPLDSDWQGDDLLANFWTKFTLETIHSISPGLGELVVRLQYFGTPICRLDFVQGMNLRYYWLREIVRISQQCVINLFTDLSDVYLVSVLDLN